MRCPRLTIFSLNFSLDILIIKSSTDSINLIGIKPFKNRLRTSEIAKNRKPAMIRRIRRICLLELLGKKTSNHR